MRYVTSSTPVTVMTRPQLQTEAGELRVCLRKVEEDLAVKRAWARVEGSHRNAEYLKWRANALTFLGKLAHRYAEVKERLNQTK